MPEVRDNLSFTTKEITPDGFFIGKAAITKAGVMEYSASELEVEDIGRKIKLYQSEESVFHPDTIKSARAATITDQHPGEFVTPDTWKDVNVGTVLGDPQKLENNALGVSIFLGDKKAIDQANTKGSEVSIGKRMEIKPAPKGSDYDYVTNGPIEINHVALVDFGRGGTNVRILDQKPDELKKEFQDIEFLRTRITEKKLIDIQDQDDFEMDSYADKVSDADKIYIRDKLINNNVVPEKIKEALDEVVYMSESYRNENVTSEPMRTTLDYFINDWIQYNMTKEGIEFMNQTKKLTQYMIQNPSVTVQEAKLKLGIQDSIKPKQKENKMTNDQIKKEVMDAVQTILKDKNDGKIKTVDEKAVTDAISNVVAPLADKVEILTKKVLDEQRKAQKIEQEKLHKVSEFKAREMADKLINDTIAKERQRFDVLNSTKKYLDEKKVEELKDASTKEILVQATSKFLSDAASKTEEYLQGFIDSLEKTQGKLEATDVNQQIIMSPPPPMNDQNPYGPNVGKLDIQGANGNAAYEAYVKHASESYKNQIN